MRKNQVLGLLLALAITFFMSACGGGATDTGASSSSSNSNSSSSSSVSKYTVSGTLSGYASSTPLVLYNNGGDPLSLTANGAFTFKTALGAGYFLITIATQPNGQMCLVTNEAGTIVVSNITNVIVICRTNDPLLIWDNGQWDTAVWNQ